MKKSLLLLASVMISGFSAFAQGTVTLTTAAEVGSEIKMLVNAVSATSPVKVDFGDGNVQNFTINPSAGAYNRWIKGTVKGPNIVVSGNLTEFSLTEASLTTATFKDLSKLTQVDLGDNQLTSVVFETVSPVTRLDLDHNLLWNTPTQNPTLGLDMLGGTLEMLTLSYNPDLECLDMRDLVALEYLTINNCENFASIFICMPEESRENLRQISIADCDLAHFYPVSLPNLTSLNLQNNNLMSAYDDSPFSMGNYPKLRSFTITGNKGIKNVDLSDCPLLEQVYVGGCDISRLDVSSCPELITLNIANTKISKIDLSSNVNLSSFIAENAPLKSFTIKDDDQNNPPRINYLNVSGTKIDYLNLHNYYFLKTLMAANTGISWLNFGGTQSGRMNKVDISNCPNFTSESMAYTLSTLWPSGASEYQTNTNLFVSGSNAEHSYTDVLESFSWNWHLDVKGDGTAEWTPVSLTFDGATDTGENKTGVVSGNYGDRVYPMTGRSMPYDLDVMETDGGKFVICQWYPEEFSDNDEAYWFGNITTATTGTVLKGVPMYVKAYPDEGKRFKSVTVNGKEIEHPWFFVSEDAVVKVNFVGEESSISFTVPQNQPLSFRVNTVENNGTIWVDWGNGSRVEFPGQRAYATGGSELVSSERIDGKAVGTNVTIYGNLAGLDVSGFGDVAADFGLWDNHITALDVTNAPDLKILTTDWNPISELDLSKNTKLEILDVHYNKIAHLDLSHNPNLMSLVAYSSGMEEEDIMPLQSIDLTGLPILQELDIKNNRLPEVDLTKNPYLRWVNLNGNALTSIDLSNNTIIEELDLGRNQLGSVDLSNQKSMVELSLDGNDLQDIDLTANKELQTLMLSNNDLHVLNLKPLTKLSTLYINGNGMSAEEINDVFYLLPKRDDSRDDKNNPNQLGWNLCLYQALDKVANDYDGNDSSIALDRGWTPSHQGVNTGAPNAYLDLISTVHGNYTVTDDAGNQYVTGSKVEKWLPLTVNAQPAEGYKLYSLQLNDDEPILGTNKFEMPGIYTKLQVRFAPASGIEDAEAAGMEIHAVSGAVVLSAAQADATVFNAAGMLVASAAVSGSETIALSSGVYIVKMVADGVQIVKTVIVK